ncbi:MAG: type II toxin-antitoxin system YafQ family toxin [Clostridiales bacterium]|jgi:mRNA interferase YafQ|nr:type II toxin-antitoxin system YafQ family toxin [Clostridiales bacterium]
MYDRIYSSRFKRDVRRADKRGKDLALLEEVIDLLADGKRLPFIYNDHPLKGNYKGYRECHIESDWMLIYKIEKNILVLSLFRTGTHQDLFDE